ncbi:MAG: hypothetical protein ACPG4W_06795 [Flavobacteriales bacterium]
MKTKPLTLILSLVIFSLFSCKKNEDCPAENAGFEKVFGGNKEDVARSAIVKNDVLHVFGDSKSFDDPNGDYYVLKLDLDGELISEKTFGGSGEETGVQILPTQDGNFILIGSTTSSGAGLTDIQIIKINDESDVIWSKTFGGPMKDSPAYVIETTSGEFCIAATTESFGSGSRDIYMLWLDQNGNEIRHKFYGNTDADGSAKVMELENEELMLFGYTYNFDNNSRDLYLLKMNALGDSIWSKHYGGSDYEEPQDFEQTTEGDFVLHGHSASTDPLHDMYTLKVDENGEQIWKKEYGGAAHDGGQSMLINSEGNYVLIGRSTSFGSGDRGIYMVTTSPDGSKLKDKVFGGTKNDWGQYILEHQAFYYIIGHSNSKSNGGDDDVYVIKHQK